MRKIFAILVTLITIFAIKETMYVCFSNNPEIVLHRNRLIVVWLSITVPLVIFAPWLWRPKRQKSTSN